MNSKSPRLPTLLALTTALSAVSAQNPAPRLISLTGGNTPTVLQLDTARCRIIDRCLPANLPGAAGPLGRRNGYDPRTGGVWISNGTVLGKVDPDTCRYQCPLIRAPIGANAVVTGLAMQESRNRLYIVDSSGTLTTAIVNDCVTVLSRCRINVRLPVNHYFSGLAFDEARGLLLYTASNFAGNSVSQALYAARAADPCNPFCATRLANCSDATQRLGGITGLAFDPCSSVVIATDGSQIVRADFRAAATGCTATNYRCCRAPDGSLLGHIGLCIRPGGATSVGRSCTNGACGTCPRMRQTMIGDPSIGNHALRFVLDNAPPRARAFWSINRGSCTPQVFVPPFCDRTLVPLRPAPIIIGPFPTGGGTAPCDGQATVNVSVPLDLALCGDDFAVQFLLLCFTPDGRVGTGLSNCLQFDISGT